MFFYVLTDYHCMHCTDFGRLFTLNHFIFFNPFVAKFFTQVAHQCNNVGAKFHLNRHSQKNRTRGISLNENRILELWLTHKYNYLFKCRQAKVSYGFVITLTPEMHARDKHDVIMIITTMIFWFFKTFSQFSLPFWT